MTVHRWPDTLPTCSAPGFGISPVDQSIRTNMEIGQQRVRRRTMARFDRMSVEWRMTEAEFSAFRPWYESTAYTLSGDSDTVNWSFLNVTRSVGVATAPDGITVDRLVETTANASHRASKNLTAASEVNSTTISLSATIKGFGGRFKAQLQLVDRAGGGKSVDIDLNTGVLSGASGTLTTASKSRGNSWWRVSLTADSGIGVSIPQIRVNALDDSGAASYVGDITKGLNVCETQARLVTGYDLFMPADANGLIAGADGGSAWFYMPVASGSGLTTAEARFVGPYKVSTMAGLRRTVTAEVEVRNA